MILPAASHRYALCVLCFCLQVVGASSTPQHSQQQPQQHVEQPGSTGQPPANGNNSSSSSSDSWPLYLQLSSGDEVGVDLLIQAIGVEPSTDWLPGELRAEALHEQWFVCRLRGCFTAYHNSPNMSCF
jgi:hypothetical protein